ncbi:MAG: copper resistance protein CopC [Vicinamibacterales bacterium]
MTRRMMLGLAAGLALTMSATVFAHMKMAKSMPAADSTGAKPEKIQIWFSQAPDKAVSRITLSGAAGEVKLGALAVGTDRSMSAAVEGAMGDGAYKVSWQAAGDDGHVQKGEYTFTVRQTR